VTITSGYIPSIKAHNDESRLVVNKRFSKPFHLVLTDSSGQTRIIEVQSMDGLRGVFDRVSRGELLDSSGFSSIQMQLWGHLAEYIGFMQMKQPSAVESGLGVMGPVAAAIDDVADLFGGLDDGVAALSEMRWTAGIDPVGPHRRAAEVKKAKLTEMSARYPGVVEVTDDYAEQLASAKPIKNDLSQRLYERALQDAAAAKADTPSPDGDAPPSGDDKPPESGLNEQGAP
jgi:hypothetical protein